jgi:hypothetical protein
MASPMVDGRVEPHRKAHYSLHISERVADSESSRGAFSSVKCTYTLPPLVVVHLIDAVTRQPQAYPVGCLT